MTTILAALLALVLGGDAAPNLAGTWNMGLQGGHVVPVALVLTQVGTSLTGTITMPTQHAGERTQVTVTGELDGRSFTMSGTVDGAAEPTTIEITGTLQENGTLEGTLMMIAAQKHGVPYTAERLKERKR